MPNTLSRPLHIAIISIRFYISYMLALKLAMTIPLASYRVCFEKSSVFISPKKPLSVDVGITFSVLTRFIGLFKDTPGAYYSSSSTRANLVHSVYGVGV